MRSIRRGYFFVFFFLSFAGLQTSFFSYASSPHLSHSN